MNNLNTHKKLSKHIETVKELVAENELLKHIIKSLKNNRKNLVKNMNNKEVITMMNNVNSNYLLQNNTNQVELSNMLNLRNNIDGNYKNSMAEFSKRYSLVNGVGNEFKNFEKNNKNLLIMSDDLRNEQVEVPELFIVFYKNGII